MPQSLLFTPTKLRKVTLRNRIVLSPMCTYSADGGMASDWHMVHLGQFALGGAGVVFTEVTAVTEQGRITYGDLGIWSNAHVAPLARVADVVRAHGAVPAIQIGHAGRKASSQRPWHGLGSSDRCGRAFAQRASLAHCCAGGRGDGHRLACTPCAVC